MDDKNWSALKRLVDSPDFAKPRGFDTTLVTLLKKVIDAKAAEISTTADKKIITFDLLKHLCGNVKIKASGATRAAFLKDALIKAYQSDKDENFWDEIKKAKQHYADRGKELEYFYDTLLDATPAQRIAKLRGYFVDEDGVEDKLKEFRQKFGIRAGTGKAKLETRLLKISEELAARRAVNGLR
jgi:hypothetical protein